MAVPGLVDTGTACGDGGSHSSASETQGGHPAALWLVPCPSSVPPEEVGRWGPISYRLVLHV